MIKKDYFPSEETPAWVKDKVMQQISAGPKKLRLISVMQYRVLASVVLLVGLVMGGYAYMHIGKNPLLVSSGSGDIPIVSTSPTIQTNTVVTTTQVITSTPTDEDLLQQKLTEAESTLTTLSNYANQEQDITL